MSYKDRIKEIITINSTYHLSHADIWEMFGVTRPIIFDGHFELLSTNHSDIFFRFAAISQYPRYISDISQEMIACIIEKNLLPEIDVVLGPTSQGMFFAFDMASKINKKVAYALFDENTGKPVKKLVKGFKIGCGERVLIVNDMTTTGDGIETLINFVEEDCDAEVIGVCLFANRGRNDERVKKIINKVRFFHSVIDIDMTLWSKDVCPLCKNGVPFIYSKDIHHLPIYSKENEFQLLMEYQEKYKRECQPHCN
jgi:orotate phosphoribosyltransferase